MFFDFNTPPRLVRNVYEGGPYSLQWVLWIFEYYFWKYEFVMGHPHPNIRIKQIEQIIEKMPYINCLDGNEIDIEPEEYKEIIDQHFETKYRRCDYNINHFFSGRIRELRFFETCY